MGIFMLTRALVFLQEKKKKKKKKVVFCYIPIIVYSGMIIQWFISALTTQYLITTFVINVSATEQYLQENTNYKKKKDFESALSQICLQEQQWSLK